MRTWLTLSNKLTHFFVFSEGREKSFKTWAICRFNPFRLQLSWNHYGNLNDNFFCLFSERIPFFSASISLSNCYLFSAGWWREMTAFNLLHFELFNMFVQNECIGTMLIHKYFSRIPEECLMTLVAPFLKIWAIFPFAISL